MHTPSSATCPGAAPVADLANLGPFSQASPRRNDDPRDRLTRVCAPNLPARCPVPMPVPTREPVPLGRSSQSAHDLSQPGELVRTPPVCRIAAREPARATNAGGAAARDECVGHARGRSIRSLRNRLLGGERRPWRPSLLARCAALNCWVARPRRRRVARRCAPWGRCSTRRSVLNVVALNEMDSTSLYAMRRCGWRQSTAPPGTDWRRRVQSNVIRYLLS